VSEFDLSPQPNRAERRFRSRKDSAAYVQHKYGRPCSASYLAKLAVRGEGPPFRKINGRWVVYEDPDLDAWALSQLSEPVGSASDTSAA
jgi:hypothetical protein